MQGIAAAECDALGVLPGLVRQRLYPEVLDAAQRAFQSDIARVRHAAAPQPVGFGEAARAAMEAVAAEAAEEERRARLGRWYRVDASPNVSPRRRAAAAGQRRARPSDTFGFTAELGGGGFAATGSPINDDMTESLFAPINFSREAGSTVGAGAAPWRTSTDGSLSASPIPGRESLSSLRSDMASGGDGVFFHFPSGVARYPRFSEESAGGWGGEGGGGGWLGGGGGGGGAPQPHHDPQAAHHSSYPLEQSETPVELEGSGRGGLNARGFGDAYDVDFDDDEGGGGVGGGFGGLGDDADAGFRTVPVGGGGGGALPWGTRGGMSFPADDEDDGMDLG